MDAIVKVEFDQFEEITIFKQSEGEEFSWAFDDMDEDLSDASDNKTVLD